MKNRIEWIDTAKGIGLLFVILGHLSIPYLSTVIYFFHMPLFFFLSGYVYSGGKYSCKDYVLRKGKSLLIPYCTYGLIILVFYTVLNSIVGMEHSLYGTTSEMLRNLLVQEHFWTIWFLVALFMVEVIYYAIDKLCKENRKTITVISALLCIMGLLRYRLGYGSLPWNLDIALVAQFFFHVGRLVKGLKGITLITTDFSICKKMVYAIATMCFCVLCGFAGIKISHESLDMSVGLYGNEVLTFVSAFAGIFCVIIVSNLINLSFFKYLGRNTMLIFALHSRVIIVACNLMYGYLGIFQNGSFAGQIFAAGVSFLIILVVTIPATELIKKFRVRRLFGL